MSLASRVAATLSKLSNSTEQDQSKFSIADDGLSATHPHFPNADVRRHNSRSKIMAQKEVKEEKRFPIFHSMIAGGIGGATGDLLMHSLDTVKTRQQGDTRVPPKYTTMWTSYSTIFKQEGIRKGLYGGWIPAMLGSIPGTIIFFGTYEFSKRHMIDAGITPQFAYLTSGFLADFAASFVYVPSEVLKTRLQLQGRYKNPYFNSGYNYRGTLDAARTIVRREGFSALFHGYKATIFRDLPFSALQFTFYEQGQIWARQWKQSREIGLPLELITGAAAGGLAGAITCPLDVVKTRIQTAIHPLGNSNIGSTLGLRLSPVLSIEKAPRTNPILKSIGSQSPTSLTSKQHTRSICTSSPSTHTPRPGSLSFDTSSVVEGLKLLYKTEGIAGWFRGVGPRFLWTSVQSGCMLFLYQTILRRLEGFSPTTSDDIVHGAILYYMYRTVSRLT